MALSACGVHTGAPAGATPRTPMDADHLPAYAPAEGDEGGNQGRSETQHNGAEQDALDPAPG
jgi:hypothetical protein